MLKFNYILPLTSQEDEPFTHIFYIVFLDAYHQFYNSDNNK